MINTSLPKTAGPDTGNPPALRAPGPPKGSPAERSCDGCSGRFPCRELSEVLESLTFFGGGLLCRGCRDASDAETL